MALFTPMAPVNLAVSALSFASTLVFTLKTKDDQMITTFDDHL